MLFVGGQTNGTNEQGFLAIYQFTSENSLVLAHQTSFPKPIISISAIRQNFIITGAHSQIVLWKVHEQTLQL
jgi:hypothetical protein